MLTWPFNDDGVAFDPSGAIAVDIVNGISEQCDNMSESVMSQDSAVAASMLCSTVLRSGEKVWSPIFSDLDDSGLALLIGSDFDMPTVWPVSSACLEARLKHLESLETDSELNTPEQAYSMDHVPRAMFMQHMPPPFLLHDENEHANKQLAPMVTSPVSPSMRAPSASIARAVSHDVPGRAGSSDERMHSMLTMMKDMNNKGHTTA